MKSNLARLLAILVFLTTLIMPSLSKANHQTTKYEESFALERAKEALEDPRAFESQKRDISFLRGAGAMTADMAKFYFVVSLVDFTHCYQSNDPTPCQAFIDSLKEPVGHIGFALFMKANHWTMDLAQIVSRGKISPIMGSYLGLASGMMAQSIFQDLYYHPSVQKFLTASRIRDPKERDRVRSEAMNEMWVSFKSGAGKYLFNKIPNVLSLLGAAYLSGTTVKVGKAVLKYIIKGSKVVRLNPVVAFGSYVVETAIFLLWAPLIENRLVTGWKRGKIVSKINKLQNKLDKHLFKKNPSIALSTYYTDQLASQYDKWRESILWEAEKVRASHLAQISKIDQTIQKQIIYYEWLAKGMNKEDPLWKTNEMGFHHHKRIDSILEIEKMAESFFCGPSSWNSVKRKIDWNGIPLPGSKKFTYRSDDNKTYYQNALMNAPKKGQTSGVVIKPWRVNSAYGVCMRDMLALNNHKRPGSYDFAWCPVKINRYGVPQYGKFRSVELHCRVAMKQARKWILKHGQYKTRNIRDFLLDRLDQTASEVMRKAWSQRDLMVLRFEKSVRKAILKAITGKEDVEVKRNSITISGDVEKASWMHGIGSRYYLGLIPHIKWENEQWHRWSRAVPQMKKVFQKYISRNNKKMKSLEELKSYNIMPLSRRVRKRHFFEKVPEHEWQKIVRQFRQFMVY